MKINIVKPFLPSIEEVKDEIAQVLNSGLVTNNSFFVQKFETDLHQYFNSKLKPLLFCNGELGLYHLIQAVKHKLGYSPHDTFEVLVPSFTFSGTINAIVQNNLKPVFCDVDDTLVLDIDKIIKDSDKIKLVIAVGAYGNLPNIEKLKKFANINNLELILDNAPAFGSKFKGEFPNFYGVNEMISLHATKIMSSMEGGLVMVDDIEIHSYLNRLRDYGQYEKVRGNIDIPGLNSKMQEVSAIIGIKNLQKIDLILNSRMQNVNIYIERFKYLEERNIIRIMRVLPEVICTYLYFPIILNEDATNFVEYLSSNGIQARRYYTANHSLDFYSNKYRSLDLSFTNIIKDRVVSLPVHTIMSGDEINYICSLVENYFK